MTAPLSPAAGASGASIGEETVAMVSIIAGEMKRKEDAGSRHAFFFSQDLAGERLRKIRKFWLQKIRNVDGQTFGYSLANSSVCNQAMAGRMHGYGHEHEL